MDNRPVFILVACLTAFAGLAQPATSVTTEPPLTLNQCYALVQAHAPLRRQQVLNDAQAANNQARLATQLRLPQVAINGQASYQSEVTKLAIDVPGAVIPTLSKDQYRLTLDASQTLYDGGTTRRQQELESLASQAGNQQV